jgi:integrase
MYDWANSAFATTIMGAMFPPFYRAMVTAAGLGEVEELCLEDLDLAGCRLAVRQGKGRKDRTVYLTDTAVRVLQDYLAMRGT